jgi:peptidoglycan/LPS O-acetylase OafA/YrhL
MDIFRQLWSQQEKKNPKLKNKKAMIIKRFFELNKTNPALAAVIATLVLISLIAGLAFLFYYQKWSFIFFAVIIGVIAGALLGYYFQNNLPNGVKFGIIGGFGGMGLDLAATAADKNPATAINTFGSFLSRLSYNIFSISNPEMEAAINKSISVGLWTAIAVIFIVLFFNKLFNKTPEPNPNQ